MSVADRIQILRPLLSEGWFGWASRVAVFLAQVTSEQEDRIRVLEERLRDLSP